jgi:RNA polymerase sigma-70 factor (ECF subfamily)
MHFLHAIHEDPDSDESLALAYRESGDMQVLGKLYQRYMELVYGVCLKYLKDPEASKDAVMQIFETLVVKLRIHEVDHFRGWLHVLARNHCLMQLRGAKNNRVTEIDPDRMQSAEDLHLNGVMEREENLDNLDDCLQSLPAGQQEAIRLFYLEQKCYQEIADRTGQPWNMIRSLIQNGRRNLKICMDKKEKQSTHEKRIN